MPDINMQTFEELQRYQLVTEFEVQSQTELTDYQVQLENADNPTQAQDNLIVDTYGESLPHWNESLDFDTWVKMNIEVSGKRGLLIHGNDGLSNGSSGIDTYHAWFDGDSTGWTEVDPNGHISFTNNRLEFTNLNRDETAYVYKQINGVDEFEILFDSQITAQVDAWLLVYSSLSDVIGDPWIQTSSVFCNRDSIQAYSVTRISGSTTAAELIVSDETNILYYKVYVVNGELVTKVYSDSARTSQISVTSDTTISGLTVSELYYLNLLSSHDVGVSEKYASGWIDNFRMRKLTSTEPGVKIGTPKNISTALKSFGRAG